MIEDRLKIKLRQRSWLELLDLAIFVMREYAGTVLPAALIGMVPFALLDAWLIETRRIGGGRFCLLLIVQAPLAAAPISLVLGDLLFGVPIRFRRLLARFLSRLPALVWVLLVWRPFLLATLMLAPYALIRYVFAVEMLLLERIPIKQCSSRGKALALGAGGKLLWRQVVAAIVGLPFGFGLAFGLDAMLAVMLGGDYTPSSSEFVFGHLRWFFQFFIWIYIAYLGVARFLLYLDRRIRLEGWDLALRLREAAASLEEQPA